MKLRLHSSCMQKHSFDFIFNIDLGSDFKRNEVSEGVCSLCLVEFQPKRDFVDESQRLYDSEPAILESLQQINDWVDNATNGVMTDFLSALPPNLLLMLINAVHFKGEMCSCSPN